MADDAKQTMAQDLLRRTFGNTTPMQSDERLMQSSAWTKEEMLAAGIPEPLHPMVTWFDSLEQARGALVPPSQ